MGRWMVGEWKAVERGRDRLEDACEELLRECVGGAQYNGARYSKFPVQIDGWMQNDHNDREKQKKQIRINGVAGTIILMIK
jgi:hypothetical protein